MVDYPIDKQDADNPSGQIPEHTSSSQAPHVSEAQLDRNEPKKRSKQKYEREKENAS